MISKYNSLYDQVALTIAKTIKFDVDKIEDLELPNKFNKTIFGIIYTRLIRNKDLVIRMSKSNSNKRKQETLQRELKLKFIGIRSGKEIK